jgi:hypothetical protein
MPEVHLDEAQWWGVFNTEAGEFEFPVAMFRDRNMAEAFIVMQASGPMLMAMRCEGSIMYYNENPDA